MRISSKIGSVLGSCLIVTSGIAMAESPSTHSEQRGFSRCVQAVESDLRSDLSVERTYFTNTHAKSREYYLNARVRRDGQWADVRIACETNRNGYKILAVNHEPGRYLGRTSAAVAQN